MWTLLEEIEDELNWKIHDILPFCGHIKKVGCWKTYF